MLKNYIHILLMLTLHSLLVGQQKDSIDNYTGIEEQIGQEGVFIHYNTPLLFSGEYFFYSVYSLSKKNNTFSHVSKVAYIALIAENNDIVFEHKVFLEDGRGQGDYFVPVDIPSGNYKLIGYTQWMKNWNEEEFFKADITIINPYTNSQKIFLDDLTEPTDQKTIYSKVFPKPDKATSEPINNIGFKIDKNNLSKREKVTLTLEDIGKGNSYGNYSISIRKIDSLQMAPMQNSVAFMKDFALINQKTFNRDNIILPELRGHLIAGRLIPKRAGLPIENQKIAFSIPGKEYKLKLLTTDSHGAFSFSLNKYNTIDNAFFQVLGNDRNDYNIEIDIKAHQDFENLTFKKFKLNKSMQKLIQERSIYNQIENAYFHIKPDSIIQDKEYIPFYEGNDVITYNLDDYTRFNTLKETVVEILDHVQLINNSGKTSFSIRALNSTGSNFGYEPLVIVDGIVIQDFGQILNYDARKIKTIRLVLSKYILGSTIFHGIIDIETIETDFGNFFVQPTYFKIFTLPMPQPVKNYFKQTYTEKTDKIPDFRQQLLWIPNIKLNQEEEKISFFTSDIPGNFEIVLQGFTFLGKPISVKKIINVKP